MATVVLKPNGDGTTTGWSRDPASDGFWDKVDEGVSAHDSNTTIILSPNNAAGTINFLLEDVPSNFDPSAVSGIAIHVVHTRISGGQIGGADTGTIGARLVRADESTAISTTPTPVASGTPDFQADELSATVTGTHDLSHWNGARLAVTFTPTAVDGTDTLNILLVTAAEVVVTYTPLTSDPLAVTELWLEGVEVDESAGGFVAFPHPRGMSGGFHRLNGGMQ